MKKESMRVAGVIVLFYPEMPSVIRNIATYIDWLDVLIVWCNSFISAEEKLVLDHEFPDKVKLWMGDGSNQGMAFALNGAAKSALDSGYRFLLTMDQDSFFYSSDYFTAFKKFQDANVAVWAPSGYGGCNDSGEALAAKKVSLAITSGSIIQLEKWSVSGGYDEAFFIDEVDHDYCLTVRSLGWSVVRLAPVVMGHQLGSSLIVRFLGLRKEVTMHSGVRLYYISRNTLLLVKKHFSRYPFVVVNRFRVVITEWFKVIFFLSMRATELKYIRKGIIDFAHGDFGKFVDK